MMQEQSYAASVVITVPLRESDPEEICDRLDDAVEQAVAGLGGTALFDGTGHGDGVFELFVYADDVDSLIDVLLEIEWPARARAAVSIVEREQRRERTFSVALGGATAGSRSREKTKKLVEQAGDWYLFRLEPPDQVVPVRITHLSRDYMLAYIFSPVSSGLPRLEALDALTASDAVTVGLVYRQELSREAAVWHRIGHASTFRADEWPIPRFDFYWGHSGLHYLESVDPRTLEIADRSHVIPPHEYGTRPPSSAYFTHDLRAYIRYALAHPDSPYPVTLADIDPYRSV